MADDQPDAGEQLRAALARVKAAGTSKGWKIVDGDLWVMVPLVDVALICGALKEAMRKLEI